MTVGPRLDCTETWRLNEVASLSERKVENGVDRTTEEDDGRVGEATGEEGGSGGSAAVDPGGRGRGVGSVSVGKGGGRVGRGVNKGSGGDEMVIRLGSVSYALDGHWAGWLLETGNPDSNTWKGAIC